MVWAAVHHGSRHVVWIDAAATDSVDGGVLRSQPLPSPFLPAPQPTVLLCEVPAAECFLVGRWVWLAVRGESAEDVGVVSIVTGIDAASQARVHLWGDARDLGVESRNAGGQAYGWIARRRVLPARMARSRARPLNPRPPIAWTRHMGGLLALGADGSLHRLDVARDGATRAQRLCTLQHCTWAAAAPRPQLFALRGFVGVVGSDHTRLHWARTGRVAVPFLSRAPGERAWRTAAGLASDAADDVGGLWSLTGGIRCLVQAPALAQAALVAHNSPWPAAGCEDAAVLCADRGLRRWAGKYALEALTHWCGAAADEATGAPMRVDETRQLNGQEVTLLQLLDCGDGRQCVVWNPMVDDMAVVAGSCLGRRVAAAPSPDAGAFAAAVARLVPLALRVCQTAAPIISLLDGHAEVADLVAQLARTCSAAVPTSELAETLHPHVARYAELAAQHAAVLVEAQDHTDCGDAERWRDLFAHARAGEIAAAAEVDPRGLIRGVLEQLGQPNAINKGFTSDGDDPLIRRLLPLPPAARGDATAGHVFDAMCRALASEAPSQLVGFVRRVAAAHGQATLTAAMLAAARAVGAPDVSRGAGGACPSAEAAAAFAELLEEGGDASAALVLLLQAQQWENAAALVGRAGAVERNALFAMLVSDVRAAGLVGRLAGLLLAPPILPAGMRPGRVLQLLGLATEQDDKGLPLCAMAGDGLTQATVGSMRERLRAILTP